jgi:hypothetical protein
MRTHCPDALNGATAYTPDELGGEAVGAAACQPGRPGAGVGPVGGLLLQAYAKCCDAGLSDDGLMALVSELSNGAAETLDKLPIATLQRLAEAGVSAETVARCNGTEDPDDLPAAWSS